MKRKSKLLKNIFYQIITTCFFATTLLLTGCVENNINNLYENKADNAGNHMSNLFSLGWVTGNKDNLFFVDYIISDAYTGVGIWRTDFDGKNKTILSYTAGGHLNTIDDWIYFINYSDDDKIYKINIDNQELQKINDTRVTFLFAYDGKLYVRGAWDEYGGHLYSMNYDGSDVKDISNMSAELIYFYNDEIYFTNRYNLSPYRIDLNGDSITEVAEGFDWADWFCVYNDHIYYVQDNGIPSIFKVPISGGTPTKIREDTQIDTRTIIFNNNTIYYFGASDSNGTKFHQVNLDTEKHSTRTVSFGNNRIYGRESYIFNGKIYHYECDEIYIMNIDGSGEREF